MIKWLIALLIAAAIAQNIEGGRSPVVSPGNHSVVVNYTGPGDVVSGATVWYSCYRAYNKAYVTGSNKSCNIMRASDNHTCDILIATTGTWGNTAGCSTGGDNGQTASSFCNATTCSVTKAYDQSGNGFDAVQATAADQPNLKFNCLNSTLPCIDTSSAGQNASIVLASASSITQSQPFSIAYTLERTGATTQNNTFIATGVPGDGSQCQFGAANSANTALFYCGVVPSITGYNDSALHNTQGLLNGSSSVFYFDGSAGTTVNPSTGAPSGSNSQLLLMSGGGNSSTGYFAEGGIWNASFNATQAGNLCHNAYLVWSGATSC